MRRIPTLLVLAVLALAARPAGAAAQSTDRWQLTLDDEQVIWDVRLAKLEGETLRVTQRDSAIAVPVARIKEVRLLAKSQMEIGKGSTGGAMGALMGLDDEVYDMSTMEFAQRLRTMQQIVLAHPPAAVPAAP